ncbi:hypothetical protein DMENIID0001_016170 [Sergentomyia squamirostris]
MSGECKVVSDVPEWLDHDYLCKVLIQDYQRDSQDWESQIIRFKKLVNNMATELFQAKLTNRKTPSKAINVMIKTISENATNYFKIPLQYQELMCKRESDIYLEFLSEVEKIQKEIGDNDIFSPKFYHSSEKPVVLILEDLSPKEYFPNIQKTTLNDSKNLLEKIAKMHAFSYYIAKKRGKDYSKFDIFFTDVSQNVPIIHDAYDIFMEGIETWPGCQQFADKLKQFKPHYNKALTNLLTSTEDNKFSVLVHGDLNIENILFGPNDDIVLIDYQVTSWRSPAYDLIGFFNSFCSTEDNAYNRDLLIKHYHENFRLTLKKLDFNEYIPTLLDVHVEMVKYGLLDLMYWSLYGTTYFARIDPNREADKDIRVSMKEGVHNPNTRKISRLFSDFLEKGYLEYED